MNSTFLESVDKWYAWKGMLSAIIIFTTVASTYMMGCLVVPALMDAFGDKKTDIDRNGVAWFVTAIVLMTLCYNLFATWLLRKEAFRFTHYPMRFNRVTRTVHVFRTDGTILSAPWNSLFFTLGYLHEWSAWEVQGHVLEKDRMTVKETFALGYYGVLTAPDQALDCVEPSSQDLVRAHWEFIRRFMEEGPESVASQVGFCMPIASKRESFYLFFNRIFAGMAGAPLLLLILITPFCLLFNIFRQFAIRTSKIPQWPADVEAACAIDPGDPYAFEGAADGTRIALFPDAARVAGIAFDPAAVHPPAEQEPARSAGRPRRSPHKKRK